MNAILNFFRIFVGVLFIFSGLIKANDTIGFGYKLEEYFDVFHLSFLSSYATVIAMILCILEIVLGALLLFGFWRKQVTSGLMGIIIFFTFLTFVSAFFKVVTSCGCFGDAIPLTPWQSFSKDLVLLVMILYIYTYRKAIQPITEKSGLQKGLFSVVSVLSLLFTLFTYNYLPVIDFLPYKVGANIPQLMTMPAGAMPDEYEITYSMTNKKTGEKKVINDKEYLKSGIWKDDNWEIIGTPESKLIKEGYQPKIRDLKITDASGTDYTKEIIENPYYSLVMVAWNLKDADEQAISSLNALALNATEQFNIRTVLLTANSAQDADAFSKRMKLFMEIFYADAVPLKSMVRANPGILLLKNGVIIDKWHYHDVPSFDELSKTYFAK
ncbi:putative membrane protein YphA (DoxX/SURF4 family) [Pedobacter sp. UYP24]